jgi:probable DNA metabolism protein
MTTIIYDGTYEGWLTAIFDIYEYKLKDVFFLKEQTSAVSLFAPPHYVTTDEMKAMRVMKGLQQHLSAEGLNRLYKVYLSEVDKSEEMMWRFVRDVFASKENIEQNFTNSAVWDVKKLAKKVKQEVHRMEAFVRFKLTKDNLYYAIVEPDHNVLPLIAGHFKGRYADQRWLIYDAKRKYGIYYDLNTVSTIKLDFNLGTASSKFIAEICDEREAFFQELWCRYFSSVNIKPRKNMRLHIQFMPKRYWKHLTEKRPQMPISCPE